MQLWAAPGKKWTHAPDLKAHHTLDVGGSAPFPDMTVVGLASSRQDNPE
jgi:hypothetical protein